MESLISLQYRPFTNVDNYLYESIFSIKAEYALIENCLLNALSEKTLPFDISKATKTLYEDSCFYELVFRALLPKVELLLMNEFSPLLIENNKTLYIPVEITSLFIIDEDTMSSLVNLLSVYVPVFKQLKQTYFDEIWNLKAIVEGINDSSREPNSWISIIDWVSGYFDHFFMKKYNDTLALERIHKGIEILAKEVPWFGAKLEKAAQNINFINKDYLPYLH